MAADLTRILADVPENSMAMRLRILADVYGGLLYTSDSGLDTSHVHRSDRGVYFDVFRGMCRDNWLVEAAPNRAGRRMVVPSAIGEFVHRHANPDRYRSVRAFEMLDGKLGTAAVTA